MKHQLNFALKNAIKEMTRHQGRSWIPNPRTKISIGDMVKICSDDLAGAVAIVGGEFSIWVVVMDRYTNWNGEHYVCRFCSTTSLYDISDFIIVSREHVWEHQIRVFSNLNKRAWYLLPEHVPDENGKQIAYRDYERDPVVEKFIDPNSEAYLSIYANSYMARTYEDMYGKEYNNCGDKPTDIANELLYRNVPDPHNFKEFGFLHLGSDSPHSTLVVAKRSKWANHYLQMHPTKCHFKKIETNCEILRQYQRRLSDFGLELTTKKLDEYGKGENAQGWALFVKTDKSITNYIMGYDYTDPKPIERYEALFSRESTDERYIGVLRKQMRPSTNKVDNYSFLDDEDKFVFYDDIRDETGAEFRKKFLWKIERHIVAKMIDQIQISL